MGLEVIGPVLSKGSLQFSQKPLMKLNIFSASLQFHQNVKQRQMMAALENDSRRLSDCLSNMGRSPQCQYD
jgi:hypothetical protein